MSNKYNKYAVILAVLMQAVLIFSLVTSFIQNNTKTLWLSVLTIACMFLPFIISHIAYKKKLIIPTTFNLVSIIFLFCTLFLGEINNFYMKYWWWDLMLHAVFGIYMVIVSLYVTRGMIRREIDISRNRFGLFAVIFAFSFAVSLGTIWEMFEFLGDFIFKTGMVKGGLEDTATDLLVKIIAALLTSTYFYLKNRES